jgi:hypothetical protein
VNRLAKRACHQPRRRYGSTISHPTPINAPPIVSRPVKTSTSAARQAKTAIKSRVVLARRATLEVLPAQAANGTPRARASAQASRARMQRSA